MPKINGFTVKEISLVYCALSDAIRDREDFVAAHRNVDPELDGTGKTAEIRIKEYRKLQKKVGKMCRP